MRVLVLNCGSSSLKYAVVNIDDTHTLASGLVERIGDAASRLKHAAGQAAVARDVHAPDHETAMEVVMDILADPESGLGDFKATIAAVGHRVVHGGERFAASALIDDAVEDAIRDNFPLAPLHNPANLAGIEAARHKLPDIPHVAVFDTAFHQHMPPQAYLYALPYELYERHGIRRYGFHGTSHLYVARRAADMLGVPADELKAITCHLGNGCSVAAVANGHSVDTSMGLTPLEGLMMGTRSGDLDPGVMLHLQTAMGMTAAQVNTLLNRQSGLLGVSGVSNDMRSVRQAAAKGDQRAQLALAVFAYRLRKYIGAYMAALGGADAVVFTGGIGENAPAVRAQTLTGLEALGLRLNEEANDRAKGSEAIISAAGSPVRILVIPTNEELVIAQDAAALARRT